jgi:hypothetical protein
MALRGEKEDITEVPSITLVDGNEELVTLYVTLGPT